MRHIIIEEVSIEERRMEMDKAEARRTIEEIAHKLYQRAGLNRGFDIKQVVERLGGRIILDKSMASFMNEFDAKIEKSKDNKALFDITVSAYHTEPCLRVSIAHEIGHLLLHMVSMAGEEDKVIISNEIYNKGDYGVREWEANEFAEAFLMPHDEFIQVAEETSTEDYYQLKEIAEVFQVPIEEVKARGVKIGLWM